MPVDPWWAENGVAAPDPKSPLSARIRDWHPAYGIGSTVRHTWLGARRSGCVREFSWRQDHLMVTVDFEGGTVTHFASEYRRG